MDEAPTGTTIRAAIVDDHRLLLDALSLWIGRHAPDIAVCAVASSWQELLGHPAYPTEVVLLDLDLGDAIPPAVKLATLRLAGVGCVVVSAFGTPATIRECLSADAKPAASWNCGCGRRRTA